MTTHYPDKCKNRIADAVVIKPEDEDDWRDITGLHLFSAIMCAMSDHRTWRTAANNDYEKFGQYHRLSGFVQMADMLTGLLESRDEYQP